MRRTASTPATAAFPPLSDTVTRTSVALRATSGRSPAADCNPCVTSMAATDKSTASDDIAGSIAPMHARTTLERRWRMRQI
jgi:hypothetical protein